MCQQCANRPPVGGIAGSQNIGCYSIAMSGGYEDDEDHGETFSYTGSGGRDLSGENTVSQSEFYFSN